MDVIAAGLPPLLPTPATCVRRLTPPPAAYASRASRRFEEDKPSQGNWRKMPGRASVSTNWAADKLLGRAVTSNSSMDRASRPMWKDASWNAAKRPASRAPSVDRSEKKPKTPVIVETQAPPATTVVVIGAKMEAKIAIRVETEAPPAAVAAPPETLFAGPSFVVSPDPSELPMPTFLVLPRPACMME